MDKVRRIGIITKALIPRKHDCSKCDFVIQVDGFECLHRCLLFDREPVYKLRGKISPCLKCLAHRK